MKRRRKPPCWIRSPLPTESRRGFADSPRHSFEDTGEEAGGCAPRVRVTTLSERVITRRCRTDGDAEVQVGFLDIEKLIEVSETCGRTRWIFLEKILPFQVLSVDLCEESCEE
ncbi:hypothetical protein [Alicyclobacillus sp.]|uniref:hypothetical protein n=1 Tax=Alicyclobacillus sp. TaxID=61169 RepID=UPI0025C3F02D|nr:hypothetical protein [Alicyclobacillus sp.]MCL6517183.1 hypothetical protein [Alicyclobacillus sp.]